MSKKFLSAVYIICLALRFNRSNEALKLELYISSVHVLISVNWSTSLF